MYNDLQKRPVAWALCRREHSVNVVKEALPFWRGNNDKLESYEDQIRLELEYLQK